MLRLEMSLFLLEHTWYVWKLALGSIAKGVLDSCTTMGTFILIHKYTPSPTNGTPLDTFLNVQKAKRRRWDSLAGVQGDTIAVSSPFKFKARFTD
jgi:hypothetical protein